MGALFRAKDQMDTLHKVHIDGREVDMIIRRHPRSKSMRLRCDSHTQKVVLTLPKRIALRDALAFFERSREWVSKHLGHPPEKVGFEHGAEIPILGKTFKVNHMPSSRASMRFEGNILHVRGKEERISHMISKGLRQHALDFLHQKSHELAEKLGVNVQQVRVRELKSLWGSCSSRGNLSFSWRLVMAPLEVAEYICAHEVSHLREMNHSPRFWAHVESLCPHYKEAKRWLRAEGKTLMRYG